MTGEESELLSKVIPEVNNGVLQEHAAAIVFLLELSRLEFACTVEIFYI
jgi:hypothetical protein